MHKEVPVDQRLWGNPSNHRPAGSVGQGAWAGCRQRIFNGKGCPGSDPAPWAPQLSMYRSDTPYKTDTKCHSSGYSVDPGDPPSCFQRDHMSSAHTASLITTQSVAEITACGSWDGRELPEPRLRLTRRDQEGADTVIYIIDTGESRATRDRVKMTEDWTYPDGVVWISRGSHSGKF